MKVPRQPWDIAFVSFEISRRHRFHRDRATLPPEVTVHVLPTGSNPKAKYNDIAKLRYNSRDSIGARLDAAYRASARPPRRPPRRPSLTHDACPDPFRSSGAAAQPVDLATIALGRAATASIPDGEQRPDVVALRRRSAVVVEALCSDRCADAFGDHPRHHDHPLAPVDQRLDAVADADRCRRLGGLAVHPHVSTPAGSGGVGARPRDPDGVQPLIDAGGLDDSSLTSAASAIRPPLDETSQVRMRLRQIVMVAADLDAAEHRVVDALGVELCFRDPGVAEFGLRNALFPVGDQLLEIVSPTEPATAAGRLLDKRGGDGGYMVMLEVDDLESLRERFDRVGARIAYEAQAAGIVGLHLHPADVGGAILSVDRAETWGEWPWAGPAWRDHVRTDVVTAVTAVEIEAHEPAAMAARWAGVLGRDLTDTNIVALDDAEIRFVGAKARGEGVAGFEFRTATPDAAGETAVCGCRFRLVAAT